MSISLGLSHSEPGSEARYSVPRVTGPGSGMANAKFNYSSLAKDVLNSNHPLHVEGKHYKQIQYISGVRLDTKHQHFDF